MTSPALDIILQGSARPRFMSQMRDLLGDARLLWSPDGRRDGVSSLEDSPYHRLITHSSSVQGRASARGKGWGLSFASASSQFASTPDADSLSFGNSTTDQAFSVVALANVTDTAASRELIAKADTGTGEWALRVTNTDKLLMLVNDASTAVAPLRQGDSALTTQGAWALYVGTYTPSIGATAADGITLYTNGSVEASTATNQVTYVAMENLGAPVCIGATFNGTLFYLDGSMALGAVCAGVLSATRIGEIKALCNQYFGLAL